MDRETVRVLPRRPSSMRPRRRHRISFLSCTMSPRFQGSDRSDRVRSCPAGNGVWLFHTFGGWLSQAGISVFRVSDAAAARRPCPCTRATMARICVGRRVARDLQGAARPFPRGRFIAGPTPQPTNAPAPRRPASCGNARPKTSFRPPESCRTGGSGRAGRAWTGSCGPQRRGRWGRPAGRTGVGCGARVATPPRGVSCRVRASPPADPPSW